MRFQHQFKTLSNNLPSWQFLLGMSFFVGLFSCTSYQHPDLSPRQVGWQPDRDLTPYLDTLSQMAKLEQIRGTKNKLDTLLEWTDLLNLYHREEALFYAGKAYELAVAGGQRFSQALAMYYRALLKSRFRYFGEGIDDALADAVISKKLTEPTDEIDWQIRINGLLGFLYFKNRRLERAFIDTARNYTIVALEQTTNAPISEKESSYLKAQLYLDLAVTYASKDSLRAISLFQEGISNAQLSGNKALESAIWRELGDMHKVKENYSLADSILSISKNLAIAANDLNNLADRFQQLADVKNYQFVETRDTSFYNESMAYLQKCLTLPHRNLYYTYELMAYNFDEYVYLNGSPPRSYVVEGDSAIVYYQKALEEAQKEGDLDIMKYMVINIGAMCDLKKQLTGVDCEELLKNQDYKEYLNQNYTALIEKMRDELYLSNARIRGTELRLEQSISRRRVTTTWLISGGGLIVAGLVFLLVLQRQRNKRLQARMEALRAQINPHFMSNSLNAIENLVNMNERAAASKYLIHFSRLTRKLLSSSRNPMTSLNSELQTLKHFLALEQLRFRDKLTYQIEVASAINADQVEVPALILQPYVENAILHGIKPKNSPGEVKIQIEKQKDKLLCIIEDDGVGRKKAQEIKAQSVLKQKHQSEGMKITEERLKMISQTKGAKVKIIDLYASNGAAVGTRVEVILPFKVRKLDSNPNFNFINPQNRK